LVTATQRIITAKTARLTTTKMAPSSVIRTPGGEEALTFAATQRRQNVQCGFIFKERKFDQ
jgi:hypothetical protein